MDVTLLESGIEALARAGEVGWFHGHFGAAVLAGERLLRRGDFSPTVKQGIADQVAKAQAAAPQLFQPPLASPLANQVESRLLAGLAPHLEALHLSGHGVIYGALALQAFREKPELATEWRVAGIEKLIRRTLSDRKNRYFGVPDYEDQSAPIQDLAEYSTTEEMAYQAFSECAELFPDGKVENNFYFFTAEKLHGVTFAHALYTLERLGFGQQAKVGLATHRRALELNRQRPPGIRPVFRASTTNVNPYAPEYWQKDHFDDHALKLALAALELLELLPGERRDQIYDPKTFWQPFQR